MSSREQTAAASQITPENMIAALVESMDVDEVVAALIKSTPPIELLRYQRDLSRPVAAADAARSRPAPA